MSQSRPAPGPLHVRPFSLEDVDVGEQTQIHSQLAEAAFQRAIDEALRQSLLTAPESKPIMETVRAHSAATDLASSSDVLTGFNSIHLDVNDEEEGDVIARGSATSSSSNALPGSRLDCGVRPLTGVQAGSSLPAADATDADEEEDCNPRSRRGQFQLDQHHRFDLERSHQDAAHIRSQSPDRTYHASTERKPSLHQLIQPQNLPRPSPEHLSERTPSLERLAERRPSLERLAERRPSLERLAERRPSLERLAECRPSLECMRERRPSLEQIQAAVSLSERRPSLERVGGVGSERRPSLERLNQRGSERRPSLEKGEETAQSVPAGVSSEVVQGINTITPLPPHPATGVPKNWDMNYMPCREDQELYRLMELNVIDREYSAITVDFEEAGLKVFSVERLQNPMLFERFMHEKDHLVKQRSPDFKCNERYLYHGTQANKQRLCEEGLDHRLSFQGCFGRGIYFSDNPRKCVQYANTNSNFSDGRNGTRPMILVCRVLLGESKIYDQGVKDSELKREPEKPKAKGGWRYYDSVQGIPIDYPEFVVYDNRRSMIEYIVTYEEVAYRAPPSRNNFYKNPLPSLYKVEPIVLPIPEKELDQLYMLGPDTDSDGSCDEHTREVERLRDNVKKGKAKRLGIPYRPPTAEEKRYERLHWKRVCYYSCPPNSPLFEMMIMKKKEEKAERKKRKQQEREQRAQENPQGIYAPGGDAGSTLGGAVKPGKGKADSEEYEMENESVAEVLSTLIADFLNITTTDDVPTARRYIMENNMDLDNALCQFFREM